VNSQNTSYSNNIVIDKSKCTFCGICVDRCILDNLRLQLSPCRAACPIGQNCQGYIQEIARGGFDKAASIIRETSPLPGVLGRICSRPCEAACSRNRADDQAVSIRNLKRYAVSAAKRPELALPDRERAESVGIVGSGPAGLMAAWELRKLGYQTRVYEKSSVPGGNLTTVIPEFRLPIAAVMEEIDRLERCGVEIRTGVCINQDITMDRLTEEHAAVLLATGANRPLGLEMDGPDAPNIFSAVSFLETVKQGGKPDIGSSVVIIGGGNSAIDAAQTARRLGVESVKLVCLERSEPEMPAFPWTIAEALSDGITIDWGWGPTSFSHKNGRAESVSCRRCLSVWEGEHFSPRIDAGTEKTFEAESFIIGIGTCADSEFLNNACSLSSTDSRFESDPLTLETAAVGIFIAGDAATGPTSVVDAMASGRRAAVSIDRYIRGDDLRYGRAYAGPYLTDFPLDLSTANPEARRATPKPLPEAQRLSFNEINGVYDDAAAREESSRCLSCGIPVGYFNSCWYCLPCEISCPEEALRVEIPYKIR
jgi:NADPH-dependent glutamate synthase beta subunit-like oxidoreductase